VASYDPGNGKCIWMIRGPTEQYVASLVYNPKADLLFMTGGFPDHHLMAIKHNGTGDVTDTAVAWHVTKASCVSYVPSPISEGDYFLVVSDTGHVNCFEAATGRLVWQERIGSHHASPVSADGLVYFLSDDGTTTVIKPGPEFKVMARNELGEHCFASPAISNGHLFIRAEKHLYCICGCD
jgi:outer membrane protein assembly factor BamB